MDFSYEVSRSLAALKARCWLWTQRKGSRRKAWQLLHSHRAGLGSAPGANKIDLPQAEPERVAGEIEDIIGLDVSDIVSCSAKTGVGVMRC